MEGLFVKFAHRRSFASSRRAFFFVCSRAVFLAAPKLSERLEEANPSSSFGVADKYLCTNSETVIYV